MVNPTMRSIRIQDYGGDEVIDYQQTPFETVVKDVDVVIDTVGGDLLERSLKVLHQRGKLVTVAGRVSPDLAKHQRIQAVSAGRAPLENLMRIVELIEAGKLKPVVGKVFPLSEARQAHEYSQTGHGRGRIILHISD